MENILEMSVNEIDMISGGEVSDKTLVVGAIVTVISPIAGAAFVIGYLANKC